MNRLHLVCLFAFAGSIVSSQAATAAAGDAARGAKAFQRCAACHSVVPGEHLTGPSLANVWGHRAAGVKEFPRYSDALKKADITWDEKTLDRWLADPERLVPGNSMTVPGIKDPTMRRDIIAYLRSVSAGKAPAVGAERGGMMMGRSQRANLKKVGADEQVVSVTHCRDTYTVQTASGVTHKIWEFNLRLKTDSSEYGPVSGKPVMTGSGMMGDRASVVFASPAEISGFVKETCD